jgi:hypothetical protein
MKKTSDSGYILSGSAYDQYDQLTELLLIKTNEDTDVIQWGYSYRVADDFLYGGVVDEIGTSNEYHVCGDIIITDGLWDMFCAKVKYNGEIDWIEILEAGSPNYNCGTSLDDSSGGFVDGGIFVGLTESSAINLFSTRDILAAKVNKDGKIRWDGCCVAEFDVNKMILKKEINDVMSEIACINIKDYTIITDLKENSNVIITNINDETLCYGSVSVEFYKPDDEESYLYVFDNPILNIPFIDGLGLSAVIIGPITLAARAETDDGDEGIDRIEFFSNNKIIDTCYDQPYMVKWKDIGFGIKTIQAVAYDLAGKSVEYKMKVLKLL